MHGNRCHPRHFKCKASQPLRDAGLGLNSQWIDSLPLLYTNRIHTGRVVDPNKEIELGVERMRGQLDYPYGKVEQSKASIEPI